ncbi:MAG TPA: hypothetical protein VE860_10820 [Chthoniobacterales bacterium]|jgi:hypothetical protein|nr:hypothetical protein [Chthoniobacterales bacterium]
MKNSRHAPAWTACGHTYGAPALPGHGISIKWSLWDSSNLVKAPNSIHPKTASLNIL